MEFEIQETLDIEEQPKVLEGQETQPPRMERAEDSESGEQPPRAERAEGSESGEQPPKMGREDVAGAGGEKPQVWHYRGKTYTDKYEFEAAVAEQKHELAMKKLDRICDRY